MVLGDIRSAGRQGVRGDAMTAIAKAKASYWELPEAAQLSIAYAFGVVPISATPNAVFEAGRSWGVIIQNGPDSYCLTAYGDRIAHDEMARKDKIVAEQERRARKKAGDAAGAYLDEIGKTDLAKLTPDQWEKFCERLTATYMHWRLAKS